MCLQAIEGSTVPSAEVAAEICSTERTIRRALKRDVEKPRPSRFAAGPSTEIF